MTSQRLHDLVTAAASSHPDRPAVVCPDATVATFGELEAATRSLAAWLATRTRPGDRVAVVADNGLAYVQTYYGVPRCGRILALVNQRLRPEEQLAALADVEPTVVVGDSGHLDALGDVRRTVPSVSHVAAFDNGWDDVVHGPVTDVGEPMEDDPAWLLFTSGSTGRPKVVVHSHRTLRAAVSGTVEGRSVMPGDTYLLPFPMCHIAGYNVLVQHSVGNPVVLPTHYRPADFVELVNRHSVTSCSLAPTMLHALLAHLEQSGESVPTLRSIAYGSAAITPELLRRAMSVLGVDLHQGYGMTETGGNVCFLSPRDHRRGADGEPARLSMVGRPHRRVEVRVLDDAGTPVAPGVVGEIAVRGEQVMLGYWRDPEATAAAVVDGWLRTGDIGRLDDEGGLAVVDRKKDVIITGGENVASREVEDVLARHPGVEAVAVVGVPDPYWGEAVCAVVVPRGAPPAPGDLVAHVRSSLAGFKRPRHVLYVDALPLSSTGKVAKEQVRADAAAALAPP